MDISFEILVNDTFSSQIKHFKFSIFFSSRKRDFETIRSYELNIDISCEILLNDTFSKSRVLTSLHSVVAKTMMLRDSVLSSQDLHFM